MLQLIPPLPLTTPKGKGLAHFVIDYGPEHHLLWVCFQDDTGECWSWSNPDIKIQNNPSMHRDLKDSKLPSWQSQAHEQQRRQADLK
jgi:hypothetical protein